MIIMPIKASIPPLLMKHFLGARFCVYTFKCIYLISMATSGGRFFINSPLDFMPGSQFFCVTRQITSFFEF